MLAKQNDMFLKSAVFYMLAVFWIENKVRSEISSSYYLCLYSKFYGIRVELTVWSLTSFWSLFAQAICIISSYTSAGIKAILLHDLLLIC